MQRTTILTLALLGACATLGGCASDPIVANDACMHTPGCITNTTAPAYGPPHAAAIAPAGPNTPR